MFEALAKSCGRNDDKLKKITYDTKQFTRFVFNEGDQYLVTYSNGDILEFRASREGATIYSLGSLRPHSQPLPTVGNKVKHQIKSISKALKQLELC